MKWANDIKAGIGRRVLANKLKKYKRAVKVCNLTQAKHIGIIYNATEYSSFEIIRDLVKQLNTNNVTVDVLGYVNSKKLIEHYLYRKGFDFFSNKDLNWYFRPVSEVAVQFMDEPFDLLLNLSLEEYFPIHFITTLSPATFKAGRYVPVSESLDFMIDIEKEYQNIKSQEQENVAGKESEIRLKFLISQLVHYLSILNK